MTLIEIFDRSPIENLVSTIALRPDQTIYIGTDVKRMQRALPVYREILDGRGIGTELIFRSAAKNDLEATLAVIDMILDERSDEPDEICLVDISGGDETLLLSSEDVAPYSYFDASPLEIEQNGSRIRVVLPPHSVGKAVWTAAE